MFGGTGVINIDFAGLKTTQQLSLGEILNDANNVQKADFTDLENVSITNLNSAFFGCLNLKEIYLPWKVAPIINSNTFGHNSSFYTGYKTKGTGNKLYIPSDATGYDSGYWLDPLQNSSKCGFTISKTL